ncbi:NAD(P)-dependent dehydrogenase (short-subunit alcohol dehydrogenase family) [Neolewinella xylanilytica]|uniref:NAD(P)-dependent dehydrogenase (Short-subunit alcohol dehydrogenase family) n=1 Tax=Neolewinella xylanilytica TaxID=1514080 RepID=A0A2S6I895_9BACT|nr:SDR family oxidoreductase [Neolewinella xylanilytica]PPK87699.1 NAD(P)-dependent dehydrogenase (short-subunit alcohol dehydrogenase family) [Neolewinella xylanilytica]
MATYLIVGGSSGIGRALVDQLLQANHTVHVWARQARDLPPAVHFTAVDVTAEGADMGTGLPDTLDGLVYCPGNIDLKSFRSLKPDAFRQSFELNVVGAVRCLQAAERALKRSDRASVVLFSTVAVQRGMPFHAAVAAAKGAVEGLTRSLAAEYAPSIRVNAIAPSLTDTPLAGKLLASDDKREASAKRHPLNRVGDPADIAAMAVFLLGNQGRFVTGQVIGMDGGLGAI